MTPIAPVPARQIFMGPLGLLWTRTSGWSRTLLFNQSRRVRDRHRPDLVRREACVEQLMEEHGETLGDRRIDRLAEIGRDHGLCDARFTDVGKRRLPRRLVRVGGREAVLD